MTTDGHIRVLPIHVANKIAAGEVVERPASVVKELVENSIDAGAKNIKISIVQGGRKLISVQDDGCGMSRDDAVLSLERQATSKIHDVDDIEKISTLGFRGEAIPSIASVSRFSMTTRTADSDEATFLCVNAGTLAEIRSAGAPCGTKIDVRDIFCNVPARRKFLRAYTTEEGHVKNIFTINALAHPDIGFSLNVDGREIYNLAPCDDLKYRVLEFFGQPLVDRLLKVDLDWTDGKKHVKIHGFIERPDSPEQTRREQFTFVNSRPASSPSIAYALREAYPRKQGDIKPAAILFIDVPPEDVDINVHPTKREVRFRNNPSIRAAMLEAISIALKQHSNVIAPPVIEQNHSTQAPQPVAVKSMPQPTIHESSPRQVALTPPPPPEPVQVQFAIEPDSTAVRPWQWFKFLAQLTSGYLLIETDMGFITVNPEAAIARIVYEKMIDSKDAVQPLLIPATVKLSPMEAIRIRSYLSTMEQMGFQMEEFGNDTFKIDSIPQTLGDLSPSSIIQTIARDIADGTTRRTGERWREDIIAKSVAKSVSRISTRLDEKGARRLVEELCACKMPYVSPQGKLIMFFTSTRELDRKFNRN